METWTNGRVELQPWQAIPQRMAALGLSDADGMEQAWFVDPDGRVSGGAAAVNGALRHCWWLHPFTYLYQLPGLRQLEEWVYGLVADNRHRLPGSTPSCEISPPSADK